MRAGRRAAPGEVSLKRRRFSLRRQTPVRNGPRAACARPVGGYLIEEIRRYPEALRFTQPLSGTIADRRDYLMKLTFEDDHGVDVCLLLDVAETAAMKAAMQTAGKSADRIAVGRVGMLADQRMCLWRVGRRARSVRTEGEA